MLLGPGGQTPLDGTPNVKNLIWAGPKYAQDTFLFLAIT